MGLIWGIPYLLIRVSVESVSPTTLVFARTTVGALVLLPLAISRGDVAPVLRRWRPMLAYTVVEIAVPWLLLSAAEQHITSSLSGLLVAAVPLVGSVILAVGPSRQAPGKSQVLGLLVGLLGVAAVLGSDLGRVGPVSGLEMAVVVVGYAAGPQILAAKLGDLPSLGVVACSLAACALAYLPAVLLAPPAGLPPARVLAAVAALGVVCTALAFVLFFALIAEVGPVRATVITYVNPAVAVVLGVTLLREPFGVGTALGFLLILAGSALATGAVRPRRPGSSPPAPGPWFRPAPPPSRSGATPGGPSPGSGPRPPGPGRPPEGRWAGRARR